MNSYNREQLYKQVWEKPVTSVAKEYGVSDTAIAKACRRLCIPLPPRGYWAKVHAGQFPEIPDLPEYIPNEKAKNTETIEKSTKEHKHLARKAVTKPAYHTDALEMQVNAFLHCCMIEEKDLIHHFKFLISCLDDEEYDNYSFKYKKGKTAFLTSCIEKIKTSHLPRLTEPWVCYECEESSSGFKISIYRLKKMHVSGNEIDSSETECLVTLMEFNYKLIPVPDFAALHSIKESTVSSWLNTGMLSNAIYQNETWLIPEFHQKPDLPDHTLFLWLQKKNQVHISGFPLVSYCDAIRIASNEKKYTLTYYNTEDDWKGSLLISKEEKNYLVVELLKLGIRDESGAFRIPFYPRKKDFHIDTTGWALCQATDDRYQQI